MVNSYFEIIFVFNKKAQKACVPASGPINGITYYEEFYPKMKNSIATSEANPGKPAIPDISAVNILIGMCTS